MFTTLVVVFMTALPVSAYVVNTSISAGASVFIGEQGLNLTNAVPAIDVSKGLGWWSSGADITTSSPSGNYQISDINNVDITPSVFGNYIGNWYVKTTPPTLCMNVQDPQIYLDIVDLTNGQGGMTVNGASVIQGEILGFKIGTNMYSAVNDPSKRTYNIGSPASTNGWADIKFKTNNGGTYTELSNGTTSQILTGFPINTAPWMWGTTLNGWNTGAINTNGQQMYPTGGYTVTVESQLNNMKNNYKNSAGADYTGKTVSAMQSVMITSNTLQIITNTNEVAQSKSFSVTITGKPNQVYHLWVKGTKSMTGGYDNQPPMISESQEGVAMDDPNILPYPAGSYVPQNTNIMLQNDVASSPANGTYYYANVTLSQYGTRTVGFITTNNTKPQTYTLHVEQNFGGQYKYDEAEIKVTKGNMMITSSGDQNYYIGETIKLSGINSVTYKTYLALTGPNLNTYGAQINSNNPRTKPITGDEGNMQSVNVNSDNTWSWSWGTANMALDTGTYTVWALSQATDVSSSNLANCTYTTISVNLRKPFISAISSATNIAQGDKLQMRGVAEGNPTVGVQLWVLGKNYFTINTQSVGNDAYFTYEIPGTTTSDMYPGQYFVVVQHPMQNGVFDIYYDSVTGQVINKQLGTGTPIFKLTGAGSLQGSDAAEALINGINDANIDDMYTKFQFTIENPYIRIHPITYKQVGTKFSIIADTNLAPDDDIMVEVYSSSFAPTQKNSNGEFSGATGTVKVIRGIGAVNQIISDIDTSTFKPDEYSVTETAVIQGTIGTSYFTVGTTPPSTNITIINESINRTSIITTPIVITTVPTVNITATTTAESPGFTWVFAAIGIVLVAAIIGMRKE